MVRRETKIMQTIEQCKEKYEHYKASGLKLDMSRGKPAVDQLDLSRALLALPGQDDGCLLENGVDCRNYGLPAGLPAMRALFAEILGVQPENVIAGGNSSLNMMFDTVAQAFSKGICGGRPWCGEKVKFLCPAPGYDRHFGITEYFGIEMINIPIGADGPDMDIVERYVENDASVKGIWCVPKYSNPTGITYSDETVRRFARLKPKADDFRIFWDNSYVLHDISNTPDTLLNLYDEAEKCGNADIVFLFTSTSKITFPGAGVACVAASPKNVEWLLSRIQYQTIGPDKLNQLRHLRMLPDLEAVRAQMARHRAIIQPKFEMVLSAFEDGLKGLSGVSWTKPNGGYFISLYVMDGCAKRVVQLCKEAGVVLTPAGSAYPYGNDPQDHHLRIAPSYPTVAELEQASQLLCVSVRLACLEKLLQA